MSLGFYLKVIYCLCARSCANRVGFYMIPYIRAHSLGVGLPNDKKLVCLTSEESYCILDLYVHDHMLVLRRKAYQKESYDVAPDTGKNPHLVPDFYVQDWLIQFLVLG
jgi:hypothetical protein